jgi:hypothetical protein
MKETNTYIWLEKLGGTRRSLQRDYTRSVGLPRRSWVEARAKRPQAPRQGRRRRCVTSCRLDTFWSRLAKLLLHRRHPLLLLRPWAPAAPPYPSPADCSFTSTILAPHPRSPLAALPCHPRAPPPPLARRPRALFTSSSTEPSEWGMNVRRQTWCCT